MYAQVSAGGPLAAAAIPEMRFRAPRGLPVDRLQMQSRSAEVQYGERNAAN